MLNRKLKNEALHRKTISENIVSSKLNISIVLDNVRSAQNVGSVFRSSDAFNVATIYLCGITAIPPNKEILKTALGATESVKWEHHEDTESLINQLKKEDYCVLSIEQTSHATMLNNFSFSPTKNYALIFGNEVEGVGQHIIDMSNEVIEIPQFGSKHSLNIAVSAGIVLWEAVKQLNS
jgi:23S rRNA (guanosine2251-2'-O)-methyltransferase